MPKARVFVSFRLRFSLTPSNIVLPLPRTTGFTTTWYSSINPSCANCETMLPLPKIDVFSGSLLHLSHFRRQIAFNQSRVVPDAWSSLLENTTFGILFILAATTGIFSIAKGVGQKLAMSS